MDILNNISLFEEPLVKDIPIKSIINDYEDGTLKTTPIYQRNYVWNQEKAKLFILSLFEGFPIPPILAFENRDGSIEIVDGQQRVRTILWFVERDSELIEKYGKLPLSINRLAEDLGIENPWELKRMFLKDPKKSATWDNLNDDIKKKFRNLSLKFIIVNEKKLKDEFLKFEIFTRINQGSAKLTPMELRKTLYYSEDYIKTLEKLSEYQTFKQIITDTLKKRLKDLEFVLEFDAFRFGILDDNGKWLGGIETFTGKYFTNLEVYLNVIMKNRKSVSDNNKSVLSSWKDALEKYFKTGVNNAVYLFGNNAFRMPYIDNNEGDIVFKKNINASVYLFEVLPLSYYNTYTIEKYKDKLKDRFIHEMLENKQLFESATSTRYKILKRLELGFKILYDIVGAPDIDNNTPRTDLILKRKLWYEEITKKGKIICPICNEEIEKFEDAELDHIYPYSLGGKTIKGNVQLVHKWCNRRKGNKLTYYVNPLQQ